MQEEFYGNLRSALEIVEEITLEPCSATHADSQRHLETLRQALAPLESLRQDVTTPNELAVRTCQRIRIVRQWCEDYS